MAKPRPSKPVQSNFRRILPKLLRRFFRRGRRLARTQAPNDKLHQFRIRTKRVRYTTELYEEVFARELRGALPQLKGIQQVLGALQDQAMIHAYFERRLGEVRSPLRQAEYQRVLHRARARQVVLRAAFFRRWERLEKSGFEKRLLERIKNSK